MAASPRAASSNLSGPPTPASSAWHESLNTGDYRGFRRNPDLQLRWFLDTASSSASAAWRWAAGPGGRPVHLRQLDRRRRAAGPEIPHRLPAPPRRGPRLIAGSARRRARRHARRPAFEARIPRTQQPLSDRRASSSRPAARTTTASPVPRVMIGTPAARSGRARAGRRRGYTIADRARCPTRRVAIYGRAHRQGEGDRDRRRQRGEHDRAASPCNTGGADAAGTPASRAPTLSSTSAARARARALARLSSRLRRAEDVNHILPFEEVARALGRIGERRLGEQLIPLDSIVGTVDRSREFDRSFRPTSPRVRERWQRINLAQRRGESMPPIDVYRIGELHFVKDGHHRVSVARALGYHDINAYVTEVLTEVGADRKIRLRDLPLQEPPAPLLRARAAAARGARAHPPERRMALRRARRGGRGLGLSRDPGAPGGDVTPRGRPTRGSARSTSRSCGCCTRHS